MTSQERGLCIIINNVDFAKRKSRHGTEHDVEKLRKIFVKLGFDIHYRMNTTASGTIQVLKEGL